MPRLTVTAKGQVTLKRELLEHLGVKPGERIDVDLLPGAKAEIRATPAGEPTSLEDFFGFLYDPSQPVLSIEEMNEIIADGWAGIRDDDNSRHKRPHQSRNKG